MSPVALTMRISEVGRRIVCHNILKICQCAGEEALALALDVAEVITDSEGFFCIKRKYHALYSCVALTLLAEIINARFLFKCVYILQ